MSGAARPELDQLAQALARLLSTWWQLRTTTATHSRAPPQAQTDQSESQVRFPTDEPLKAGQK
jgi:hypothetical protein